MSKKMKVALGIIFLLIGIVFGLLFAYGFMQRQEEPDVDVKIAFRDEVLSCAYKVYSNPAASYWLARAFIKNCSECRLYNFHIRYRIKEFSDWSIAQKYEIIKPSQVLLDFYYPILPKRITAEKTMQNANLQVEWAYYDRFERKYTGNKNYTLKILGPNSLTWSSLPEGEILSFQDRFNNYLLIGAFVTRTQNLVRKVASMALKGLNTTTSDDDALEGFVRIFYALRQLGIGYVQEPMDAWSAHFTQNIQSPAECIENKSGTCIDLAILYASMLESYGIRSVIILIPGHAMPGIVLSNGTYYPIESTFIDKQYTLRNFANAVSSQVTAQDCIRVAQQSVQQNIQKGTIIFMYPRDAWKMGVVSLW